MKVEWNGSLRHRRNRAIARINQGSTRLCPLEGENTFYSDRMQDLALAGK